MTSKRLIRRLVMANPSKHTHTPAHLRMRPLSLHQLQRLKDWHIAHRGAHPMEYEVWNAVLTVWLMGWIGCLPALTFDTLWALPLCLLGVLAPQLYVRARARAHEAGRLRCDWLAQVS
jgi:hypothetical protein